MGSLMENLQKKKRLFPSKPCKDDLPISDSATKVLMTSNFIHLRKRISTSFSVPPLTTTSSSAWGFRKSRSMPSLGEFSGGPLRRWWEWSWGWLLARKPAFVKDIEMNEEEISMLGCNSRGSFRHVFYKVRSEFRKLVRSDTLPTRTHKFNYI